MPIYDLTLPGFDGATDETDHLVKWVKAPNEIAVLAFCKHFDITYESLNELEEDRWDMELEDGVDVILDENGEVTVKGDDVYPETWRMPGEES